MTASSTSRDIDIEGEVTCAAMFNDLAHWLAVARAALDDIREASHDPKFDEILKQRGLRVIVEWTDKEAQALFLLHGAIERHLQCAIDTLVQSQASSQEHAR